MATASQRADDTPLICPILRTSLAIHHGPNSRSRSARCGGSPAAQNLAHDPGRNRAARWLSIIDLEAGRNVRLDLALAVIAALDRGLRLVPVQPAQSEPEPPPAREPRVKLIPVAKYPQLKMICWNLRRDAQLTPEEALARYERNWRFVDPATLTRSEARLIDQLKNTVGKGALNV
jgi:hypothetical protein